MYQDLWNEYLSEMFNQSKPVRIIKMHDAAFFFQIAFLKYIIFPMSIFIFHVKKSNLLLFESYIL